MAFDRDRIKRAVSALAQDGVFIGTSSWKYLGWRDQLYDQARYVRHGRFSKTRFENLCLAEYAEVFKTVSVDAAYYKFPERDALEDLVSQVPDDFLFAFKVTDEITVKKFPDLPRFGLRAGKPNENFLNADLFASAFLSSCEPVRRNIGLLMFEFSRFYPSDFEHRHEFVAALDAFLARVPQGWPYGVEIRNRYFLYPDYFGTLARYGAAHIFNSWTDMPPVSEQLALPGSRTNPEFCGARFLLNPGRKYEDAVKLFSPYDRLKEINEEGRVAGARLIKETVASGGQTKAFIYLNNRFEGNALETIAAIIEMAEGDEK